MEQLGRHPHRRLPVRPGLRASWPTSAPEAVRIQAETFSRLVTGQIAETIGPAAGARIRSTHYMQVIADKTASLIATSGRFGAMFSGAREVVATGSRAACEPIGVACQLSDDVLDVASESAQSGKTPGTDLREGVRTLPVLYALRSPRTTADARLRELLGEADLTDTRLHAEALALLRGPSGDGGGPRATCGLGGPGPGGIAALPDVPARAAFEALCDFVVRRTG